MTDAGVISFLFGLVALGFGGYGLAGLHGLEIAFGLSGVILGMITAIDRGKP